MLQRHENHAFFHHAPENTCTVIAMLSIITRTRSALSKEENGLENNQFKDLSGIEDAVHFFA